MPGIIAVKLREDAGGQGGSNRAHGGWKGEADGRMRRGHTSHADNMASRHAMHGHDGVRSPRSGSRYSCLHLLLWAVSIVVHGLIWFFRSWGAEQNRVGDSGGLVLWHCKICAILVSLAHFP